MEDGEVIESWLPICECQALRKAQSSSLCWYEEGATYLSCDVGGGFQYPRIPNALTFVFKQRPLDDFSLGPFLQQ